MITAPLNFEVGKPGAVAITLFFIFISLTLVITYWAARKTKNTEDFYTAGKSVTGLQNGLALAGDYMSAASFLGISGLVAFNGFDGFIYLAGWIVGWPILLFFVAEPLRNLGRYTLADAVASRLKERPIRIATAFGSLAVVIFYMISQMVGGGYLIKMMFGLEYETAEILVGTAMICYVLFGGMLATTWVQIIKAVLLLGGGFALAVLTLGHFNYNPLQLFAEAAQTYGPQVLAPGKLVENPWNAFSLGLGLMLGTAALPHILMRFYTVTDAKAARLSVFYATGFIGLFYLLTFIIGFGAMMIIKPSVIQSFDKSGNIAALLLAVTVGGSGFLGFIAAVAFATVLAVVAGLTLSGAATLSHDFWVSLFRKDKANPKEALLVARISTVFLGALSIFFGIVFKAQNVAFMVGLAFAIAASANLPALLLVSFWRRCTTAGIVSSMLTGTFSSLILIYFSPPVQIDILHNPTALFPLTTPGLVSIPLSFMVAIIVSLLTKDTQAYDLFPSITRQIHLGEFAKTYNESA